MIDENTKQTTEISIQNAEIIRVKIELNEWKSVIFGLKTVN